MNPWLPKNRFYELKYYCLQYPTWMEKCKDILEQTDPNFDPTGKKVVDRLPYLRKIESIHRCLSELEEAIRPVIFEAITKGKNPTVDEDVFYENYRLFFATLDRYLNAQ